MRACHPIEKLDHLLRTKCKSLQPDNHSQTSLFAMKLMRTSVSGTIKIIILYVSADCGVLKVLKVWKILVKK